MGNVGGVPEKTQRILSDVKLSTKTNKFWCFFVKKGYDSKQKGTISTNVFAAAVSSSVPSFRPMWCSPRAISENTGASSLRSTAIFLTVDTVKSVCLPKKREG